MITQEQVPEVLGHAVCDTESHKIGNAKCIFLDDASGRPEWVSVKTGLLSVRKTFVPLRDATINGDHLEVPYSKSLVKDAPKVDLDAGGHMSSADVHRLYAYYGIE
ncbi:PRC-barrel domain-containing protein [Streptomyces sp. NPDC002004]